jgi:hypothetical protein
METSDHKSKRRGQTKTHCIRGHDRSLSRIGEDCRVCDRERNRLRPRTPEAKYLRYKRDLAAQIQKKQERIHELERILHAQEN